MSELREQVRELMQAYGQAVPREPCIPDDAVMRLRAGLILEECLEMLEAVYGEAEAIDLAKAALTRLVREAPVKVDFPEFVDALGDIDVVTCGAYLSCAVDSGPIHAAIHRANMAKLGGPVDPSTKKQLKPVGWTPPDIVGVLKAQGWKL